MSEAKQNLTVLIEDELLRQAGTIALEQGTSLDQLVRGYLKSLVEAHGRQRLARTRLRIAFEKSLIDVGELKWTRAGVHDR